ncbi:hypothetical protein E4U15_000490, partial [Claviceps sp. LM218 group G6]
HYHTPEIAQAVTSPGFASSAGIGIWIWIQQMSLSPDRGPAKAGTPVRLPFWRSWPEVLAFDISSE